MLHGFPICTSTRKGKQQILFTVCLSLLIQWLFAQRTVEDVNASVGDTVILSAPASEYFLGLIHWYRGNVITSSNLIFTYHPGAHFQTNAEAYTGRETGLSNGSLQIAHVQAGDSGNYIVIIEPHPRLRERIQLLTVVRQLRVYADLNVLQETTPTDWETVYDVPPSGVYRVLAISLSVFTLMGAAVIVGVVLICKARRRHNAIQRGEPTFQNAASCKHLEGEYENWNGQWAPSEAPPTEADSHYTELRYGDQAVYKELKRI